MLCGVFIGEIDSRRLGVWAIQLTSVESDGPLVDDDDSVSGPCNDAFRTGIRGSTDGHGDSTDDTDVRREWNEFWFKVFDLFGEGVLSLDIPSTASRDIANLDLRTTDESESVQSLAVESVGCCWIFRLT